MRRNITLSNVRGMVLAVLGLVSCNTLEQDKFAAEKSGMTEMQIEATLENKATKTSTDDTGKVYWSPKDSIMVFFGDYAVPFYSYNTRPATKAMFVGTALIMQGDNEIDGGDGEEYAYWAVYPAQTRNFKYVPLREDGEVYAFVDPSQTAAEGTFDKSTFITVAKSDNYQKMAFYNLCGGVRFCLASSDIDMVTFCGNNGEALSGEVIVKMDGEGHPYASRIYSEANSVRLKTADGSNFKPGVWYYITSLPCDLSKGFTMKFISRSGSRMATYTQTGPISVKRSIFGTLTEPDKGLEFTEYDLSEEKEQISQFLDVDSAELIDGKLQIKIKYPSKAVENFFKKIKFEAWACIGGSLQGETEGSYVNLDDKYLLFDVGARFDENALHRLTNEEMQDLERFLSGNFQYTYVYRVNDGKVFSIKKARATDFMDANPGYIGKYKNGGYVTYYSYNVYDERGYTVLYRVNGLFSLEEDKFGDVVLRQLSDYSESDFKFGEYSSYSTGWQDKDGNIFLTGKVSENFAIAYYTADGKYGVLRSVYPSATKLFLGNSNYYFTHDLSKDKSAILRVNVQNTELVLEEIWSGQYGDCYNILGNYYFQSSDLIYIIHENNGTVSVDYQVSANDCYPNHEFNIENARICACDEYYGARWWWDYHAYQSYLKYTSEGVTKHSLLWQKYAFEFDGATIPTIRSGLAYRLLKSVNGSKLLKYDFNTDSETEIPLNTEKFDQSYTNGGVYFYGTDTVGYPMFVYHGYTAGHDDFTMYVDCRDGKVSLLDGTVFPTDKKEICTLEASYIE